MKILEKLFGTKKIMRDVIVAPMTGDVVALSEAPDDVFANKILGDGVVIIPSDGEIVAPVDGLFDWNETAKHAFSFESADGLQILVHVGIDTVKLKGEGFEILVPPKTEVKKGDVVARANLNLIKEKNFPIHTPVIIIDPKEYKNFQFNYGKAEKGLTEIISYAIK